MKMKYVEFLSKDEIETIHSASLDLLSTVGIKIDDEEVRNLLRDNGAEVDSDSHFVKIPENLLKETLKTVPDSFKLYGRDGKYNFEVNTHSTVYATIGTPVKIWWEGKLKKTRLEDNIKQIRVVDALENIVNSHTDIWPHDLKFTSVHVHCIYQWAKNTRKPYGMGCLGKVASQDMMDMMSIIVGGEENKVEANA